MIVVRLMGGMGNQLFQYASAKSLAIKKKTGLILDISHLNSSVNTINYTQRNFELQHFNIEAKIASFHEFDYFSYNGDNFLSSFWKRFKRWKSGYEYYSDYSLSFHKEFFEVPENTYLDGYFQSEKYFIDVREKLLNQLRSSVPMNDDLYSVIKKSESVAVHFRRGDFEKSLVASERHGTCAPEYYNAAFKMIKSRLENPLFFIFSDNIDWAKEQLKNEVVVYVENKGENSTLLDFELMRVCKHQIIANSTFSWWGAWLNENKDKIVIAPEKWLNDLSINTKDIIPETWIRI